MSGVTLRCTDMAVSHAINALADPTDPGCAECVSFCVLRVREAAVLHCKFGVRGVRGELKQRDGLHLSARSTLKWPSLRID